MADHAAATNTGLVLSDGSYDVLRQIVEKVFPGLGVLYAALAAFWGWGYEVQVGGSFAALAVFGGILLSLARKGYTANTDVNAPPGGYDGQVVSDINDAGEPVLRLQLDTTAAENLLNKQQIVFKGYDPTA